MNNDASNFKKHKIIYAAGQEKQEEATFAIYFNLALSNIEGIIGDDLKSNPTEVPGILEKLSPVTIRQVASFIWLSKEPDPDKAYSVEELKVITTDLVRRLCFYRNYFSHVYYQDDSLFYSEDYADTTTLGQKLPYNFYYFIYNRLFRQSLPNVWLFKKDEANDRYEILRDGLVFFCCLFLKRGQAELFLNELKFYKRNDEEGKVKRDAFTRYCTRESHKHIGIGERDFLIFHDIIGDLNKVPEVCERYGDLEEENQRHIKNREQSEESDENKARHRLLTREKDKFAYYLLRYIVDFNVLPSVTFKQNDYSEAAGRGKYHYQDQAVGDEAKTYNFVVKGNNVYYSYIPKANIKRISELQGTISVTELRNMVFAAIDGKDVNKMLDEYLCNLHRLYERILDIDGDTIKNKQVCIDDFTDLLDKLLLQPSASDEERERAIKNILPKRVCDLLYNRLDSSENEVALEKRLKAILQKHEQQLSNSEASTHIEKINAVVDYLYLFFDYSEKFRQLPVASAHRGLKDEEFQMFHYLIGDYDRHPAALWKELRASNRMKPELEKLTSATSLNALYELCLKGTVAWCRKQIMSIGKGTANIDALAERIGLKLYGKLSAYTAQQLKNEVELIVMHGNASCKTPKPKAQAAVPCKLVEKKLNEIEISFTQLIRGQKDSCGLSLRNFYNTDSLRERQKRCKELQKKKELFNAIGQIEKVHAQDLVLLSIAECYKNRLIRNSGGGEISFERADGKQQAKDIYEIQKAWLRIVLKVEKMKDKFEDFTLTGINLSNLRKAYNLLPQKHIKRFVKRNGDVNAASYSKVIGWLKENHSDSSLEREAATMMVIGIEKEMLANLTKEKLNSLVTKEVL
jgi:hypothetical protein